MSIYSSSRKMHKHSRSQQGHLRLSAFEESSALIVHIFEARGLMRKDSAVLDIYIKLYLLPDAHKTTKKKTKTVCDQDPVFNQKFTFLLTESDAEKRLFVSAWMPHFASRNVMIGCMSFPVASLVGPESGLKGWFQLLDEEKGMRENQPVPVSISSRSPREATRRNNFTRPGTCEIAVTVCRGENGYGFDIRGHNPVYISSVEPGEPAQQVEVRVGDAVMMVNDTDVRRANAELIKNLIDNGGSNLHLILLGESSLAGPDAHRPPLSALSLSPRRATNTLPHSYRLRSPTHANPHRSSSHPRHYHSPPPPPPLLAAGTLTQPSPHPYHPPLSSSVSHGALSQQDMPLSAARSSHHYYSLSHLPRARGPPSSMGARYRGGSSSSSDILSQPVQLTGFDYSNPQDQFVHDAVATRHSSHSLFSRPSPHSHQMDRVNEEREDHEEEDEGVWNAVRPPPAGQRSRERERGKRRRRVFGEDLTQPATSTLSPHHYHNHRHRPPLTFSFSQPGEPGMKSTHTMTQVDHTHHVGNHAPYHTHNRREGGLEKDARTGERRHYRAPTTSFSPNHPSQNHGHHGNVKLIGHQPLGASRSYGYGTEYGNGTVLQEVPCSMIGMEDGPMEWESLSPAERKRQKALQSLVETESTFCSMLQDGIETYLEPLRSVISENIHSTLFCNLKELYEVSSRIDGQLKERRLSYVGGASNEATPYFITDVADIYHYQLPELLGLLKGYLDNLHTAKQELSIAFTNEAFSSLVQRCVVEERSRSIHVFIEAGKDYVSRLFKTLLGVYYTTSPSEIDQSYLSTALRQLSKICPDKDMVKRWEVEQKVMQKLEVCISFAPKIPKIPIAVPGRVLVREGEAHLIEKKGKTKVWLLLFSDVVLITQRRRGTLLMCLEPAFPLSSLRVGDFNCTEDTEFQITNTEGSLIRLLRVASVAEKSAWMACIGERATGSFQRKHGERLSRVSNLPKLPRQTDHPLPPSRSEPNNQPPGPRGGDSKTRGGRRRPGRASDPPPPVKTEAGEQPVGWKRSGSRRRSFNLFGGKGNKEKKKKAKKDLPSPSSNPQSIGDEELTVFSIPPEALREWRKSLDVVLQHPAGRILFHRHLSLEHSMENMEFCMEVDHFKTLPDNKLAKEAKAIAAKYVGEGTPKALNIDSSVAKKVEAQLKTPHRAMFDEARQMAYDLMSHDTFRRFKTSPDYIRASQRDLQPPHPSPHPSPQHHPPPSSNNT